MTTLASDDFNRANANPIAGNWHEPNFMSSGQLLTNGFAGVSTADPPSDSSYFDDTTTSIPADCWVDIVVRAAATSKVGGKIRGDNNGSGYEYIVDTGVISSVSATAVRTNIGTRLSGTIADGDTFRLQAVGTTITIWRKPSGGNFAQVGADLTNATISAAGFSSVVSGGATHIIEAWAAGNMTGEPTAGGGGGGGFVQDDGIVIGFRRMDGFDGVTTVYG